MSQQNVEVVRRFIDAVIGAQGATGWAPALAELAADVEIDDLDITLDTELYRGHDKFDKWMGAWNASWESWSVDELTIRPVGEDRVIALFLMNVKGRGSGIELSRRDALVCTLGSGKITEIGYYNDQRQAHRAVGLAG